MEILMQGIPAYRPTHLMLDSSFISDSGLPQNTIALKYGLYHQIQLDVYCRRLQP